MEIDDFLDKETKGLFDEKEDENKIKNLKIENPDILDEVKKYLKQNDYLDKVKLALGRNDFHTAEKLYYELWAKLSDKVVWNQKIHDELLKICSEISSSLSDLNSNTNKKKEFGL